MIKPVYETEFRVRVLSQGPLPQELDLDEVLMRMRLEDLVGDVVRICERPLLPEEAAHRLEAVGAAGFLVVEMTR